MDNNDEIQKFIKNEDKIIDESNGDIIIYQTENGLTKINVKIENETVWLSQQQMAELFSTSRTNIIEHINNIYEEELNKNSTCQNFRQVRKEGNRNVTREIPFYNLDMILSSTGEKLLTGAGKISHDKALEKAKAEYKKYQVKTISPVEQEYLNTIKEISKEIKKEDKK